MRLPDTWNSKTRAGYEITEYLEEQDEGWIDDDVKVSNYILQKT